MKLVLVGVLLPAFLAACGASRKREDDIPIETAPDEGTQTGGEMRPLEAGQPAPDFALTDVDGRTHTLSELRVAGPVVIVFYQGSWCGGCRAQLQRFQSRHRGFVGLGASLVAISADSGDKSRRLAETLKLEFPVLSDGKLSAATGFGVVQNVGGLSLAAVFVIDQGGVVRWVQIGEAVPEDQALDAVRALVPRADGGVTGGG